MIFFIILGKYCCTNGATNADCELPTTTKAPSTTKIDRRYLPVSLAPKTTKQPWTRTYNPYAGTFKYFFTIFPYKVQQAGSWYTRKNVEFESTTKSTYQREDYVNGIDIGN